MVLVDLCAAVCKRVHRGGGELEGACPCAVECAVTCVLALSPLGSKRLSPGRRGDPARVAVGVDAGWPRANNA
jgi:hypothetical protein